MNDLNMALLCLFRLQQKARIDKDSSAEHRYASAIRMLLADLPECEDETNPGRQPIAARS
jgi:hypothetical protein